MPRKTNFSVSMTLKDAVWQTVNRGRLTPNLIEDKIGYSESSLKRAGLDGDSGAGFNLFKLIPLMDVQNDYSVLELLNYRCGFIQIPIPRGGRSKKERIASVSEYQMLVTAATNVLVKFIHQGASSEEAIEHLYRALKGTAEMLEEIKAGNQIELDL